MIEQTPEQLSGTIERVIFHGEETGFCVLSVKAKSPNKVFTVTGNLPCVEVGEHIDCEGTWINDKRYGVQLKATVLKIVPPTTLAGIEKYLHSGMVKGVGKHFAKKLLEAFGKKVFDVIENEPDRLRELKGIGKKRKAQVIASLSEQKVMRDLMVFLQSHGIGAARSVRIYKTYGEDAIKKIQTNPYALVTDIRGMGFTLTDALACELGTPRDSLMRARAGVNHTLKRLCDNGHCAVPLSTLIQSSSELLDIPVAIIEAAIEAELHIKNLIKDTIRDETCIYLASLYHAETQASTHIKRLNTAILPWGTIALENVIPQIEKKTGVVLADSQRHALKTVLTSKLSIITGGPGVGKTTIVNSLLHIIQEKGLNVALCAPTGRAAKRLMEITGIAAKTIHRLLCFDPFTYGFIHNQDNPLRIDLLIVDESSMIDIELFNHLLKGIPDHAAVIFVGDIDQLPSVGSGAVLSDLIDSGIVNTVKLTEIFRQAQGSQIILNAHRINEGQMPLDNLSEDSDFFTLYADSPDAIHSTLIELVTQRLPQHYQCDPIKDIQVLTPMNRGGLGTIGLNIDLQNQLIDATAMRISRFSSTYAVGDKVIQTTNNYSKDVFNGDIGFIEQVDVEVGEVNILFDNTLKTYSTQELDEIRLAYAISIHKSQGSEFPIIVIPLTTQHHILLARNLLYTGITRGKRLVVLVGQKQAISMAVNNNKAANRRTKFSERLREP